jgi:citrate lyase synthetase
MITNQPHTPDMNMSTHDETSETHPAEQLTLEGFADPRVGIDPRFILSDETCRIGRQYLAEMRRILASGRAQTDIQNGRATAAQHDGRAQAA